MASASAFLLIFGCLCACSCRAEPEKLPEVPKLKAHVLDPDRELTIDKANGAIRQAVGEVRSLKIDRIFQDDPDGALVYVMISNIPVTLTFKRAGEQWRWISASSSKWEGPLPPAAALSQLESLRQ